MAFLAHRIWADKVPAGKDCPDLSSEKGGSRWTRRVLIASFSEAENSRMKVEVNRLLLIEGCS